MSLRSIKTGATAITEAGVLQFITDLVKASGVFDILRGDLSVTAGLGLSVNIATGRAYLLATSGGNCYPIINDAVINNLAINPNSSGNPRITSIVLYKNLGGSANSDDTNTTFIVAVDGTPAASPTPPNGTQITTVVGAGNPYIVLSNVRVNNAATVPTSIDNSICPQVIFRTDIFNDDRWIIYSPTFGATLTLDLSLGKKFQINMPAGNITLAIQNVPLNPKSIIVRVTQDSTGGRSVTWFGGLTWPNSNTTPSPSSTPAASDEYVINFLTVTDDTHNTSEGFQVGTI